MAIIVSGLVSGGSISIDGLDGIKSLLDPKSYDTALRNAANKCAKDAFKDTIKGVESLYNIKIEKRGAEGGKRNTGQFFFQPGSGKKKDDGGRYGRIYFRGAMARHPIIELDVQSRPFPLYYFMAPSTPIDNIGRKRKGDFVVVEVEKGKSKLLKNAFVARFGSNHIGIVHRRSEKKMTQGTWKKKPYANKFKRKSKAGVKGVLGMTEWSAPYAVRESSVTNGAFMLKKSGVHQNFDNAFNSNFPSHFSNQMDKLIKKGIVEEEDVFNAL